MEQGSRTACQSRIIDSARRIIFSKGIESLTTREIAKDLQLTNGSLYRHFKNKKEIISILIDDIEETLLDNDQGGSGHKRRAFREVRKHRFFVPYFICPTNEGNFFCYYQQGCGYQG